MTCIVCLDEGGGATFFGRPQTGDRVLAARIASIPDAKRVFSDDDVTAECVDTLIIYRWNRKYPRDFALALSPFEMGLTLDSIIDFAGSSHERITEETWKRRRI